MRVLTASMPARVATKPRPLMRLGLAMAWRAVPKRLAWTEVRGGQVLTAGSHPQLNAILKGEHTMAAQ